MTNNRIGTLLAPALSVAFLLVTPSLFAQEAPKPFEPSWKIDGEVRLKGEHRDEWDLNSAVDDKDEYTLSRVRLGVLAKPVAGLSAYVQIQDSRTWGSEASTASNEKNLDLHQGWIKAEKLLDGPMTLDLQAGRFEMSYGDQRLIGAFNWSNIGRSFDGLRATGGFADVGQVDFFATKVGESAPRTGDGDDVDFQGLYFQGKPGTVAGWFQAYLLRFADDRVAAGEQAGATGETDILTFGARVAGKVGGLSIKAEGALQSGERAGDDHSAWASAIVLDQSFQAGSVPMTVGGGWALASGDSGADGDSEEFENLFPTNHLHYGYMDLFGWRNLSNPFLRFGVKASSLGITLDLHRFDLLEETGAWKNAAGGVMGRDATGGSGSHVGDEIDLVFSYPIREKLKAELGIARFFPGEFAEGVRGDDAQDWAYLSLTLGF